MLACERPRGRGGSCRTPHRGASVAFAFAASATAASAAFPAAVVPADAAAEARTQQLRVEAASFVELWRAKDAAGAAAEGGTLAIVLAAGDVVDAGAVWRSHRRGGQGEGTLTRVLELLDALPAPLLPSHPALVDGAQCELRLQPPAVHRVMVPLLLTAMEAYHAKFLSLKRGTAAGAHVPTPAAGAGGAALTSGAGAELQCLRERAEALVAFGGMPGWRLGDSLEPLRMAPVAAQQLAGWLAEMS